MKKSQTALRTKTLKRIYLEYDDGTMLSLPEDKTLSVGTSFMKAVGGQQLDWQIIKSGHTSSFWEKIKKFFMI